MNWLTDHELKIVADGGYPYQIKPTEEQIINLAKETLAYRELLDKLKAVLGLPNEPGF